MIAILQPFIPHYREEFFELLNDKHKTDVFCYENIDYVKSKKFKKSKIRTLKIPNISFGPFLIYNPSLFFSKEYKTLVLMLHFGHITTWFLLLTKFIHNKEIILWGQGISVKRYIKEELKPSVLIRMMIFLSDGIWTYTKKEEQQWRNVFQGKKIISLDNTISDVSSVLSFKPQKNKEELKSEYNIKQKYCFIFCARFNEYRRIDLFLKIIERVDSLKYGFLVIGEGNCKPDFKEYNNVYDYGAVYENKIKQDLFTIADFYFQPGWLGLSVVEAMAYGKPIITFKRSKEVLQCVEYYYLKDNINSKIVCNSEELIKWLEGLDDGIIQKMSHEAKDFVSKNLRMENMVNNALNMLN